MKKTLLISFILFFGTTIVLGQSFLEDSFFDNKEFTMRFLDNTFLLSKNLRQDKTTIVTAYKMQKGNFCSPLATRDKKGGAFETSSFLALSKWKLYGDFYYGNMFSEKSLLKLGAFDDDSNNPLFFIQRKSSPSQTISYIFKTIASRKIFDDKTYLGLEFDYEGGSFYKKLDWRNTQHILRLTAGISIGRELADRTIGLDILMNINKTKPNLSSVYQHGYDDKIYKHYISVGFGSLEQRPSYSFEIKTLSPKISLFLQQKQDKTEHIWRIKGSISSCVWKDVLIKDIHQFDKPYKNKQFVVSTDYLLKIQQNKLSWSNFFKINYLKGDSFWREENSPSYAKASWNKNLTITYTLYCEQKVGFWRKAKFQTIFQSRRLRDKNYGNKFSYSKLNFKLDGNFILKKDTSLTLGIAYTKLLSHKKSKNAILTNQFMSLVGNDFINFWTAESLAFKTKIDYRINKKKNWYLFVLASHFKRLHSEQKSEQNYLSTVLLGMKFIY